MKILLLLFTIFCTHPLLFSEEKICVDNSPLCKKINRWYRMNSAAGNIDDYYDNRDRGHSSINLEHYPQVKRIEYSDIDKLKKNDYAAQNKIVSPVTIGNSSTVDVKFGSHPRAVYYLNNEGMKFLYTQYRKNNLYIYPEHRDYDPYYHDGEHPGRGDLYPTNSPYLLISQGSSGSDKPFLDALFKTSAAFRPEVKEKLVQTGMLMPTLQQILRMSSKKVKSKSDYLSGKAHPAVFDGQDLDINKMVDQANAMTLLSLPPLPALEEVTTSQEEETFTKEEALSTTPSVIAKIFKGPQQKKKITLSAKNSKDINGLPLKYHWVQLSGDKDHVTIEPSETGETATITLTYQPRFVSDETSGLMSNRTDIALFADNGFTLSPPAFFTVYTLPNELRTYDDKGQLKEIFYGAKEQGFHILHWSQLLSLATGNKKDLLKDSLSEKEKQFLQTKLSELQYLDGQFQDTLIEYKEIQKLRKKLGTRIVPWKDIYEAKVNWEKKKKALNHFLDKKYSELENQSIRQIITSILNNYSKKNSNNALTNYERFQKETNNLRHLTEKIYPGLVEMWQQKIYVDERLSTSKPILKSFGVDKEGNSITLSEKEVRR